MFPLFIGPAPTAPNIDPFGIGVMLLVGSSLSHMHTENHRQTHSDAQTHGYKDPYVNRWADKQTRRLALGMMHEGLQAGVIVATFTNVSWDVPVEVAAGPDGGGFGMSALAPIVVIIGGVHTQVTLGPGLGKGLGLRLGPRLGLGLGLSAASTCWAAIFASRIELDAAIC